ncbi:MAG: hypothetical protein NUV96_02145 [Candidatus Colwellbacteria bacterium]|nr:hypothetical protein [Candidatus Colwellbacteria bacterium]
MNYTKEYSNFLEQFLVAPTKIRVLFDLSNGSTEPTIKELFGDKESIEAIFINDNMDGNFPGHGPNPLDNRVAGFMQEAIAQKKADLGIVFDGDGDRVFFFDNLGASIDSYEAFNFMKGYFKAPYILDVRALHKFTMPEEDIVETKVGRYFIPQSMRENNAEFGAEYTGHFYFKNFFYVDSGILASIYMINYLSNIKGRGKTLSDMRETASIVKLPETNFSIESPRDAIFKVQQYFDHEDGVELETMDGVTAYGKDFALNIRASETEPVVRFTLAAKDNDTLAEIFKKTKKIIGINE